MDEVQQASEKERFLELKSTPERSLAILKEFQADRPFWEAQGGDLLLIENLKHGTKGGALIAKALAMRVCRLEYEASQVMVKGAVSQSAAAIQEKEAIPPDQLQKIFSLPNKLLPTLTSSAPRMTTDTAARALSLPSVLCRVLVHLSFPSKEHRLGIKHESGQASAARLLLAEQVSVLWKDIARGCQGNTAWEIATRLRWPLLPSTLKHSHWRALHCGKAEVQDKTPSIENCHSGFGESTHQRLRPRSSPTSGQE